MTTTIFCYGPAGMDLGNGFRTDGNGQLSVATGAAGGSNAGASVLNAIRVGMISCAPKTAGFNTASTAATTAIAAIGASPTTGSATERSDSLTRRNYSTHRRVIPITRG